MSGDLAPDAAVRVLLVEDSPVDVLLVRRFLAQPDALGRRFEIAVSATCADALAQVSSGMVDVVLLDLNLPDSAGLSTFRALVSAAPVPTVVLSSLDDEAMALEAVRLGAQDYLVKGDFTAGLLRRTIHYALERARLQKAVAELSLTDELTGLRNLRGFRLLAEEEWRAARRRASSFVLAFADLDGLKRINDTLGHPAGDQAIQDMADALRATFRDTDLLGRVGGDEFVVLFRDVAPEFSPDGVRRRLLGQLGRAAAGRPYPLAASIGFVYCTPGQQESLDQLLSQADQAMYQDKVSRRAGREPSVSA